MTYKLDHLEAYVLSSLSKHAEKCRNELQKLEFSIGQAKKHGIRMGVNLEAATRAQFHKDSIEELLDQLYESISHNLEGGEFNMIDNEYQRLQGIAINGDEKGDRIRFTEDQEL